MTVPDVKAAKERAKELLWRNEIRGRSVGLDLGVARDVLALAARVEQLEAALRWIASEDAWEVTPQYATDGRYRFNTTPESVYATPWGFARAALNPAALPEEPPRD